MSDAGGNEEGTDYSKMKVNDLKKLLKIRGLPMTGNKQELVERLQTSEPSPEDLLDGSEVGDGYDEELEREIDESALIGDDPIIDKEDKNDILEESKEEEEEGKGVVTQSPKKANSTSEVVREAKAATPMSSEETPSNGTQEPAEAPNTTQEKRKISLKEGTLSATEASKKKLRAERFGAKEKTEEKSKEVLAKRAERFAINSTTTSTATSDSSKVSQNEVLKKRAERFGILSPAELKRQHLEKLQARKMRFSSSSSCATSANTVSTTTTGSAAPTLEPGVKPTQLSADQRKKLRAERFKAQ